MLAQHGLTLTVVTQAGRLEHRGKADLLHGSKQSFPARDRSKWSGGDTQPSEKRLFGETILRIADFPPDSSYPDDAASVIFSEIDGHEEAYEAHNGSLVHAHGCDGIA